MSKYYQTSNDYEIAQRVAKIRHRNTAYDRADAYFNTSYGINKRHHLNDVCRQKDLGEITEDEFNKTCHMIIADVNLDINRNKKRFCRHLRDFLRNRNPYLAAETINKMAEQYAWHARKSQYRRNSARNGRSFEYIIM